MKVVCVYLTVSIVQSARSQKHPCCALKLLSLILGMSHLQKPFDDAKREDSFWREFSYKSL